MRKNSLIRTGLAFFLVTSMTALSWTPVSQNTAATPERKKTAKAAEKPETGKAQLFDNYVQELYTDAGLQHTGLDAEVFKKALTGYINLQNTGKLSGRQILSIVDFTRSSGKKRLWIIDLAKKELLYNTYVAHGQGSGDDMAVEFSNKANSHQSSPGFYVTGEVYRGKHGLSLRLDGMDESYNGNARSRAIVVHGADYVSESFIEQHGRLGRSYGCPAIPVALTAEIINAIKGNTCLFIHVPQTATYTSAYLNAETAMASFMPSLAAN